MYDRILVPYDKSEHAKHALQTAIDLVDDSDESKIVVLYVTELPEFEDPAFAAAAQMAMAEVSAGTNDEARGMHKEYYEAQRKAIADETAGIVGDYKNITFEFASGKPQDAIEKYASSGDYDIVIMGCRGLGALRGALGSVSFAVLRSVDIPVLVVK